MLLSELVGVNRSEGLVPINELVGVNHSEGLVSLSEVLTQSEYKAFFEEAGFGLEFEVVVKDEPTFKKYSKFLWDACYSAGLSGSNVSDYDMSVGDLLPFFRFVIHMYTKNYAAFKKVLDKGNEIIPGSSKAVRTIMDTILMAGLPYIGELGDTANQSLAWKIVPDGSLDTITGNRDRTMEFITPRGRGRGMTYDQCISILPPLMRALKVIHIGGGTTFIGKGNTGLHINMSHSDNLTKQSIISFIESMNKAYNKLCTLAFMATRESDGLFQKGDYFRKTKRMSVEYTEFFKAYCLDMNTGVGEQVLGKYLPDIIKGFLGEDSKGIEYVVKIPVKLFYSASRPEDLPKGFQWILSATSGNESSASVDKCLSYIVGKKYVSLAAMHPNRVEMRGFGGAEAVDSMTNPISLGKILRLAVANVYSFMDASGVQSKEVLRALAIFLRETLLFALNTNVKSAHILTLNNDSSYCYVQNKLLGFELDTSGTAITVVRTKEIATTPSIKTIESAWNTFYKSNVAPSILGNRDKTIDQVNNMLIDRFLSSMENKPTSPGQARYTVEDIKNARLFFKSYKENKTSILNLGGLIYDWRKVFRRDLDSTIKNRKLSRDSAIKYLQDDFYEVNKSRFLGAGITYKDFFEGIIKKSGMYISSRVDLNYKPSESSIPKPKLPNDVQLNPASIATPSTSLGSLSPVNGRPSSSTQSSVGEFISREDLIGGIPRKDSSGKAVRFRGDLPIRDARSNSRFNLLIYSPVANRLSYEVGSKKGEEYAVKNLVLEFVIGNNVFDFYVNKIKDFNVDTTSKEISFVYAGKYIVYKYNVISFASKLKSLLTSYKYDSIFINKARNIPSTDSRYINLNTAVSSTSDRFTSTPSSSIASSGATLTDLRNANASTATNYTTQQMLAVIHMRTEHSILESGIGKRLFYRGRSLGSYKVFHDTISSNYVTFSTVAPYVEGANAEMISFVTPNTGNFGYTNLFLSGIQYVNQDLENKILSIKYVDGKTYMYFYDNVNSFIDLFGVLERMLGDSILTQIIINHRGTEALHVVMNDRSTAYRDYMERVSTTSTTSGSSTPSTTLTQHIDDLHIPSDDLVHVTSIGDTDFEDFIATDRNTELGYFVYNPNDESLDDLDNNYMEDNLIVDFFDMYGGTSLASLFVSSIGYVSYLRSSDLLSFAYIPLGSDGYYTIFYKCTDDALPNAFIRMLEHFNGSTVLRTTPRPLEPQSDTVIYLNPSAFTDSGGPVSFGGSSSTTSSVSTPSSTVSSGSTVITDERAMSLLHTESPRLFQEVTNTEHSVSMQYKGRTYYNGRYAYKDTSLTNYIAFSRITEFPVTDPLTIHMLTFNIPGERHGSTHFVLDKIVSVGFDEDKKILHIRYLNKDYYYFYENSSSFRDLKNTLQLLLGLDTVVSGNLNYGSLDYSHIVLNPHSDAYDRFTSIGGSTSSGSTSSGSTSSGSAASGGQEEITDSEALAALHNGGVIAEVTSGTPIDIKYKGTVFHSIRDFDDEDNHIAYVAFSKRLGTSYTPPAPVDYLTIKSSSTAPSIGSFYTNFVLSKIKKIIFDNDEKILSVKYFDGKTYLYFYKNVLSFIKLSALLKTMLGTDIVSSGSVGATSGGNVVLLNTESIAYSEYLRAVPSSTSSSSGANSRTPAKLISLLHDSDLFDALNSEDGVGIYYDGGRYSRLKHFEDGVSSKYVTFTTEDPMESDVTEVEFLTFRSVDNSEGMYFTNFALDKIRKVRLDRSKNVVSIEYFNNKTYFYFYKDGESFYHLYSVLKSMLGDTKVRLDSTGYSATDTHHIVINNLSAEYATYRRANGIVISGGSSTTASTSSSTGTASVSNEDSTMTVEAKRIFHSAAIRDALSSGDTAVEALGVSLGELNRFRDIPLEDYVTFASDLYSASPENTEVDLLTFNVSSNGAPERYTNFYLDKIENVRMDTNNKILALDYFGKTYYYFYKSSDSFDNLGHTLGELYNVGYGNLVDDVGNFVVVNKNSITYRSYLRNNGFDEPSSSSASPVEVGSLSDSPSTSRSFTDQEARDLLHSTIFHDITQGNTGGRVYFNNRFQRTIQRYIDTSSSNYATLSNTNPLINSNVELVTFHTMFSARGASYYNFVLNKIRKVTLDEIDKIISIDYFDNKTYFYFYENEVTFPALFNMLESILEDIVYERRIAYNANNTNHIAMNRNSDAYLRYIGSGNASTQFNTSSTPVASTRSLTSPSDLATNGNTIIYNGITYPEVTEDGTSDQYLEFQEIDGTMYINFKVPSDRLGTVVRKFKVSAISNPGRRGDTIAFDNLTDNKRWKYKFTDTRFGDFLFNTLVSLVGRADRGHQARQRASGVHSLYAWINNP